MKQLVEGKIVQQLGCVARVAPAAAKERRRRKSTGGTAKDPFLLDEVELLKSGGHPYLETETAANLRRFFLYHSGKTDARQIVMLFAAGGKEGTECHVWLSNKFRGAEASFNVKSIFGKLADSVDVDEIPSAPSIVKVNSVGSASACWKGASKCIAQQTAIDGNPIIVVAQSPIPLGEIISKVPAVDALPIVYMPAHDSDSEYPALAWQPYAAECGVGRYLTHCSWFNHRLDCARYSHIPVAHIGDDFAVSVADTFYARILRHNNFLLWSSPGDMPDIGGEEEDTSHLSLVDLEKRERDGDSYICSGLVSRHLRRDRRA